MLLPSVNRMLTGAVMPPEVMALDIETDCATDAARVREGAQTAAAMRGGCGTFNRGSSIAAVGGCRRGTLNLDLPECNASQ